MIDKQVNTIRFFQSVPALGRLCRLTLSADPRAVLMQRSENLDFDGLDTKKTIRATAELGGSPMVQNRPTPNPKDEGFVIEALSNEVLKLKIDDLYEEIGSLRARLRSLESRLSNGGVARRARAGVPKRPAGKSHER